MKFKLYLVIILHLISFISCSEDNKKPDISTLSEEEINDLSVLREEEKLARDVYLYALDKYNLNIFRNISNSEQIHMDKVLQILKIYKIADPTNPQRGVYKNTKLQNLYTLLIEKVNISLSEALIVGATIEDLDIKDIVEFKERTSKDDILYMYNKLECGSRNHLRAYYSNLKTNGGSYVPQYISLSYFNSIINNNNEKCGK